MIPVIPSIYISAPTAQDLFCHFDILGLWGSLFRIVQYIHVVLTTSGQVIPPPAQIKDTFLGLEGVGLVPVYSVLQLLLLFLFQTAEYSTVMHYLGSIINRCVAYLLLKFPNVAALPSLTGRSGRFVCCNAAQPLPRSLQIPGLNRGSILELYGHLFKLTVILGQLSDYQIF